MKITEREISIKIIVPVGKWCYSCDLQSGRVISDCGMRDAFARRCRAFKKTLEDKEDYPKTSATEKCDECKDALKEGK